LFALSEAGKRFIDDMAHLTQWFGNELGVVAAG
jgi:hypothetical protein